jgi:hypothetical protein
LVVSCGNDEPPVNPDAAPLPDGGPPPEFTQSGTVGYLDLQYVNLPPPFDMLGNGPLAAIGPLQANEDIVPPSWEELPGAPFGCKVFELTPEQYIDPGLDVGPIEFTVHGGDWVTPPCVIVPGVGWACPGGGGSGGDIRVVDADMGIFSLQDPGAGFTGEQETGRYLSIEGAGVGPNNGMFFVVGALNENTILFFNPGPGEEELDTAGQYVTIAGFGPAGRDDPIPDDALLDAKLTASTGGDSKFEDFEVTGIPFGQSFVLDTASQETISNIPSDGSAFQISCEEDGGQCNAAMATALILETSDGDHSEFPPFLLAPAEQKVVRIFCLNIIAGASRVPAEASQFLVDSGATRIRTVFARVFPADVFQTETTLTILAGHAQAGFTDY